jgi:asparagine synthase (glutamine-hydrolysing)
MCGICGFVNLDGAPASPEIVGKMNRALRHRGPDDVGVLVEGAVALAMTRLAIIDPAGGHQPIANENKTVWIVFNGEIYNAGGLRQALVQAGHRFTSSTDTETILHLYEDEGEACTSTLRGMFAFAILDKRVGGNCDPFRLLVARDRLGIKPLYYYRDERLFAFSSELTSLVQHPSIVRGIDPTALVQYLATGIVAAPLTMFPDIKQLMPGERMILQGGTATSQTYWRVPEITRNPDSTRDAVLRIRELMEQSVAEHLASDVPIGAFLSGGIDSSSVVALMARASGNKIPTFSIRFEESTYDESAFARLVAAKYDTDHHEFTVPNQGFDADLLYTMITHHGQPTADSSAIPTFIVSQLARKFVKVALSGDGGDECFAGYSHYGWLVQVERLRAIPEVVRQGALVVLRRMARSPGLGGGDYLRRAINAIQISLGAKHRMPLDLLRLNDDREIRDLLLPGPAEAVREKEDQLSQFLYDLEGAGPIGRAQRFSFRYFLPDAYLPKVDRMSMAASLEVRVPFLDHRLVEYALSLPGGMHWRGGEGKRLLRRAVVDLLPPAVLSHRKQGFSIPLHRWTTRAYFDLAEELLSQAAVERRGLFRPNAVRILLDRCQGKGTHFRALESDYRLSHRLFLLVVLEMWCRTYVDRLLDSPGRNNLINSVQYA